VSKKLSAKQEDVPGGERRELYAGGFSVSIVSHVVHKDGCLWITAKFQYRLPRARCAPEFTINA
jgi:hypothetical protein